MAGYKSVYYEITNTRRDPQHIGMDSPAKNVWLVVARPRNVAKFKMVATPIGCLFQWKEG